MCRNQFIHSHDELFTDLLESSRNITCQFGTDYVRGVCVLRVQNVQCVFWLKGLDHPYKCGPSVLHANILLSLVHPETGHYLVPS